MPGEILSLFGILFAHYFDQGVIYDGSVGTRQRYAVAAGIKEKIMGLLLIIVLLLLVFGGLPTWGYSRNWGYGPSGILGILLIVLLVLLVFERTPFGWY
jgi:Protein of unknown function (DUF3309)